MTSDQWCLRSTNRFRSPKSWVIPPKLWDWNQITLSKKMLFLSSDFFNFPLSLNMFERDWNNYGVSVIGVNITLHIIKSGVTLPLVLWFLYAAVITVSGRLCWLIVLHFKLCILIQKIVQNYSQPSMLEIANLSNQVNGLFLPSLCPAVATFIYFILSLIRLQSHNCKYTTLTKCKWELPLNLVEPLTCITRHNGCS